MTNHATEKENATKKINREDNVTTMNEKHSSGEKRKKKTNEQI